MSCQAYSRTCQGCYGVDFVIVRVLFTPYVATVRCWDCTLDGRLSWHELTTCFTGVASKAAWMRDAGQAPSKAPRLNINPVMSLCDSRRSNVFHFPNNAMSCVATMTPSVIHPMGRFAMTTVKQICPPKTSSVNQEIATLAQPRPDLRKTRRKR